MHLTDKERADIVIQVWSKTIDVQQHFNDIELKIRSYALTAFTFIITGIGFVLQAKIHVIAFNFIIPGSGLIALFGIVILYAFYFMDKHWYHVLLKGAVTQALDIERGYKNILPELNLTHTIGSNSEITYLGFKVRSNQKSTIFYGILMGSLFLLFIFLLKWDV